MGLDRARAEVILAYRLKKGGCQSKFGRIKVMGVLVGSEFAKHCVGYLLQHRG